jgi:methionyl aminopeptidase
MIRPKSPEEINRLAEGGQLLARLLDELEQKVVPGATGQRLDQHARKLAAKHEVTPSFLGYVSKGRPPYPAALCLSVNDAVVHGLPNVSPFQEGDIVGIDMGIIYKHLYLDSARTVPVGRIADNVQRLIDVTKQALQLGIEAAQPGHTTGHIGQAIQQYVEQQGFGVVRQLVGHGVGYAVHEEPQVPNFGRAGEGEKLVDGLVIAIEPMVTIGDPAVGTAPDHWTIVTKSGNPSAHQEHTVAVTTAGPKVLTTSNS